MDHSSFYGSRRHRPDDDSSSNCSSSSSDWNPTASEEDSSTSSESDSPVHVESTAEDNETEMDNSEVHADNSWTPIVASQRSFRFTGKEQLLKKPTPSGENNLVVPLDVYSLFVTDETIASIVHETNRYATQILLSKAVTRKSRLAKWIPTDAKEMRMFLGIVVCMGLVRAPKIEHYWSKKEMYNYSFIRNHMSRDRFQLLLNMLHFNDNEVIDRQNKLHKIQPLIDSFSQSCRSVYTPGSSVVIDEHLMNSKGVKVCNWKDKRNVLTLSTVPEHSGNLQPSGKKDRNGTEILKPQNVLDYNTAKCGVDKSDQMTSYNTALRRSTKWYRKLAIELLTGTAVVNAWVLYNQFYSQQKTMGVTEFKECLVMSLITGKMNEEMLPGPKRSDIGGLRSSHSLVEAEGPKLKTRKRCRSCNEIIANNESSSEARRKARRVTTFCDSCDGKPSLCVSCFSLRHSPPV